MRRGVCIALLSGALAVAWWLQSGISAKAMNPARAAAAEAVLRAVAFQAHRREPDAAFVVVHNAWRDAGASLRAVDAAVAAHRHDAGADSSAYWFFNETCGAPLSLGDNPPELGDLVRYKLAPGGLDQPWRIGMFVGESDVAVYSPAANALTTVVWQELGPGSGTARPINTEVSSFAACRFSSSLLPGGADGTTSAPGSVTLIDPGQALQHFRWSAAHPRDADMSFLHGIQRVPSMLLGAMTAPLLDVLELAGGGVRDVLERMGWPGAALLALWAAAGTAFDGHIVHRVLTTTLIAIAVVIATAALGPAGTALVLGGVFTTVGAASLGIPVLGHLGRAVWNVASFVTSVVTGVDDSSRASIAGVAVAVLGDAFIVTKPASLAMRFGAWGARAATLAPGLTTTLRSVSAARVLRAGGRALLRGGEALAAAFSHLNDATQLRPYGIRAAVDAMRGLPRAAPLRRLRGLPAITVPAHRVLDADMVAMQTLTAAGDVASLAWRPTSLLSDITGHADDLSRWLRADLAGGARSWPLNVPGVRAVLMSIDPQRRARILDTALPHISEFGRMSHLHSGTRALGNAAAGHHLSTAGSAPPPDTTVTWPDTLPQR